MQNLTRLWRYKKLLKLFNGFWYKQKNHAPERA